MALRQTDQVPQPTSYRNRSQIRSVNSDSLIVNTYLIIDNKQDGVQEYDKAIDDLVLYHSNYADFTRLLHGRHDWGFLKRFYL